MASAWHRLTLLSAVAFVSFSAAHLIDEFVWGVPAEFHLSVEITEVLALLFVLSLTGLAIAAARGSRVGLAGLALAGILLVVADVLKHAGEILEAGPWRSGAVSTFLAIGLTLSALSTAVAALCTLRQRIER